MLKVQNKSTKRIRVIQIIVFLIQIFLTSQPFVWGGAIFPQFKKNTFTVLDMISYIGTQSSDVKVTSTLTTIGLCYILFLVIPVVAVAFQIFDREYNLKNIVGIICSFAGVLAIIYLVGPQYLCFASMISLLLYLFSAFMSVMGIFARFLKTDDNK
ncbi:MAG: hypothetical protein IJ903_03025 [Ruminococcus sp.]|nr:hypothetical protein [Ruminococcus sp.]